MILTLGQDSPMLSSPTQSPVAAATHTTSGSPTVRFAYRGSGMPLFALMLKNMLLSLVTLGIYLAWAKTERRTYLWQNIEVHGHRLRYHGTGKELFFGYLKVVLGYLVFMGVPLAVGAIAGKTAGSITQVLLALALLPLIPFAIWGSRRYLLSRTSWRGVHMRLEGSGTEFAKTLGLGYLLTIVTFGFYAPIWFNRIHRVMVNASGIGTKSFDYRGEDKVAFRMGVKGFFLSIITLGIYSFWYQAELARFQIGNTWFDGAKGEIDITGGDMFKLTLLQIFGLTFSLGLAFPWIMTYSLQFMLERIRFAGPIDFAHIYQTTGSGSAAADGLADALDVGLGL
jgi:uncharacterized membrane protein YjgN (DUF898 family)